MHTAFIFTKYKGKLKISISERSFRKKFENPENITFIFYVKYDIVFPNDELKNNFRKRYMK